MPKGRRIDQGGLAYHVLNRGVRRQQLFFNDDDFAAFEELMAEAVRRFDMRVVSYCLMPNHWHQVLWPRRDGDLSGFMHWLTCTHATRWNAVRNQVGEGHVYQGRYKSFVIQSDAHLFAVCRYVERNARRADLVERADLWRWCSLWRRLHGDKDQRTLVADPPIPLPTDWAERVDQPLSAPELEGLRAAAEREIPFGEESWVAGMAARFGIDFRLRRRGRPNKRCPGGHPESSD